MLLFTIRTPFTDCNLEPSSASSLVIFFQFVVSGISDELEAGELLDIEVGQSLVSRSVSYLSILPRKKSIRTNRLCGSICVIFRAEPETGSGSCLLGWGVHVWVRGELLCLPSDIVCAWYRILGISLVERFPSVVPFWQHQMFMILAFIHGREGC